MSYIDKGLYFSWDGEGAPPPSREIVYQQINDEGEPFMQIAVATITNGVRQECNFRQYLEWQEKHDKTVKLEPSTKPY